MPTATVLAWGKAGASLNPWSPGSPEWEGNSRQVPAKQDTHFRAGLYSGVKYVLQPRILSACHEDSSYSHELFNTDAEVILAENYFLKSGELSNEEEQFSSVCPAQPKAFH